MYITKMFFWRNEENPSSETIQCRSKILKQIRDGTIPTLKTFAVEEDAPTLVKYKRGSCLTKKKKRKKKKKKV